MHVIDGFFVFMFGVVTIGVFSSDALAFRDFTGARHSARNERNDETYRFHSRGASPLRTEFRAFDLPSARRAQV